MSTSAHTPRVEQTPSTTLDTWSAHLQAALSGPLDLPPLSPASAAIAAMAADGNANAAVLAQLVHRDPTVAAHVLRVANSAAFAPRAPVVTMQQAIAWLGMGEIQSIAMAIAVRSQLFAGAGREKLLNMMWQTAIATACWAREIARARRTGVELAHLCGLLHRLGRPVVLRCLAQIGTGERSHLTSAERSYLIEQYEQRAGIALSNAWKLPEPVSTTIEHWRDENYDGPWRLQVQQVRLAELLAARMLEQSLDPSQQESLQRAYDALNLYPEDVEALEARGETVQKALAALG